MPRSRTANNDIAWAYFASDGKAFLSDRQLEETLYDSFVALYLLCVQEADRDLQQQSAKPHSGFTDPLLNLDRRRTGSGSYIVDPVTYPTDPHIA